MLKLTLIEVIYHMPLYFWCIITSNAISVNLSVSPSAPLVKIYLYMWNRQGVHKFHWISSCLCNHDDILLYLYWHTCPCCVSKYIWWEAISYFESWNIFSSNKMSHCCLGCSGNSDVGEICLHLVVRIPQAHKIAKVKPPLLHEV